MKKPAYPDNPGDLVPKRYAHYSPYQDALWQALDDAYHADAGSYEHTRQPSPGASIDPKRYEEWEARVFFRWGEEAPRQPTMRALLPGDWQPNLMQYMYDRMLAAEPSGPGMKQETYTYED
mgnify:CR=1 FL=1